MPVSPKVGQTLQWPGQKCVMPVPAKDWPKLSVTRAKMCYARSSERLAKPFSDQGKNVLCPFQRKIDQTYSDHGKNVLCPFQRKIDQTLQWSWQNVLCPFQRKIDQTFQWSWQKCVMPVIAKDWPNRSVTRAKMCYARFSERLTKPFSNQGKNVLCPFQRKIGQAVQWPGQKCIMSVPAKDWPKFQYLPRGR